MSEFWSGNGKPVASVAKIAAGIPLFEEAGVARWVPKDKRTTTFSSATICDCCGEPVVFLKPLRGQTKVVVYVNGRDGKPNWDGNPYFSASRHSRHNGWVYKTRILNARKRAAGFDPTDPLLRED